LHVKYGFRIVVKVVLDLSGERGGHEIPLVVGLELPEACACCLRVRVRWQSEPL
jgi:hypothetical protein